MENKLVIIVGGIVGILFVVSMLVNASKEIPENLVIDDEFEYEWICSSYDFFSQQDADTGWLCLLNNCTFVEKDDEEVRSCICGRNGNRVNTICTDETLLRHRNWPDFEKPSSNSEEEE